jgi:hypothetical protein
MKKLILTRDQVLMVLKTRHYCSRSCSSCRICRNLIPKMPAGTNWEDLACAARLIAIKIEKKGENVSGNPQT